TWLTGIRGPRDRSKRDENETKGEFVGASNQDVFIEQCECHAQVLIASLLALLSAIKAVEPQLNSHDYGSLLYQLRTVPESDQCEDYNDITRWMDERVKLNAQLKEFQEDIGALQSSLNGTTSCCSYENTTLLLINENVNAIMKQSGLEVEEPEASEDLGRNLEDILSKIKQAVFNAFNICCENWQEKIDKFKVELEERVQNMAKKLKEEKPKDSSPMEEELEVLESQIKDLKSSLEKLQNQNNGPEVRSNCCDELKGQIQDLNTKTDMAKSAADEQIKAIENQIKKLKDNQQNLEDKTTILKNTINEKTENVLEKWKKSCENDKNLKSDYVENDFLIDLGKKVKSLLKFIKNHPNKLVNLTKGESSTNYGQILDSCSHHNEKLSKMLVKLQNTIKPKPRTGDKSPPVVSQTEDLKITSESNKNCSSNEKLRDRIEDLQKENKNISEEVKNFPKCCEKIEDLTQQADRLKIKLEKMNQTFNDHKKANKNSLQPLKDGLDAALKKLVNLNQSESSDHFQDQLNKIKRKLSQGNLDLGKMKNKQDYILKVIENATSQANSNELEKLQKDFEEFRLNVERKLKDYKNKKLEKPAKVKEREKRIEELTDKVRQDKAKLLKTLKRHEELEEKVKDKLEKLKTPSSIMLGCQKKCKEMSNMDVLKNQIKEAEKLVKQKVVSKPIQERKPLLKPVPKQVTKPLKKPTPKPKKKYPEVYIGGVDYIPLPHRGKGVQWLTGIRGPRDRSKRDENETKGEFVGSSVEDVFIQQCECHAQVLIASLLALLSAIKAVEPQLNTHDYGSLLYQLRTASETEQCDDYNDVTRWMEEHMKLNVYLEKFKNDQSSLLIFLNETISSKICRFYEENTLQLINDNLKQDSGNEVQHIHTGNEVQNTETGTDTQLIVPEADLDKNLENILSQIKKNYPKGLKTCCEDLNSSINELKDELGKRLKNLTEKSEVVNPGNSSLKDVLEKKLKMLMDEIEDIKQNLQMLQPKLSGKEGSTKCCTEIQKDVKNLNDKLTIMKTQADNRVHRLGSQLKDLKDKQRNNYQIVSHLNQTTVNRVESIKDILNNCENNCVKKNVIDENNLEKIKNMKNLQVHVEKNDLNFIIQSPANLSEKLETCKKNIEKLTEIQSQIEYLINNKTNTCFRLRDAENVGQVTSDGSVSNDQLGSLMKELQKEREILHKKLEKFEKCCQNIVLLHGRALTLKNDLKLINETYKDYINILAYELDGLKDHMDEAQQKLFESQSRNIDDPGEQIKMVNKEMDNLMMKLKILIDREVEVVKDWNKLTNSTPPSDVLDNLEKNLDKFSEDVDKQLKDFEVQKLDSKDPLGLLQSFNNKINQVVNNVRNASTNSQKRNNQIQDQIKELQKQATYMLECKNQCLQINNLNDIIDRVEDLEVAVKTKVTKFRIRFKFLKFLNLFCFFSENQKLSWLDF
ncbi:reticulocyte-binding protein PFD0110w, partial [Drosophila eugracilis]|uniref:reticulocyte-binding protein PFD0110w n=1 Tax=Drosophila eugracilis TaxID=29029 RepID=UPI001BD95E30